MEARGQGTYAAFGGLCFLRRHLDDTLILYLNVCGQVWELWSDAVEVLRADFEMR